MGRCFYLPLKRVGKEGGDIRRRKHSYGEKFGGYPVNWSERGGKKWKPK